MAERHLPKRLLRPRIHRLKGNCSALTGSWITEPRCTTQAPKAHSGVPALPELRQFGPCSPPFPDPQPPLPWQLRAVPPGHGCRSPRDGPRSSQGAGTATPSPAPRHAPRPAPRHGGRRLPPRAGAELRAEPRPMRRGKGRARGERETVVFGAGPGAREYGKVKGEQGERRAGGSVTGWRCVRRPVLCGGAPLRLAPPRPARCPQAPRAARRHVRLQALHPRAGGAAVPRPSGHEETRVRGRALERLWRKSAAGREHRGCCAQVRPGLGEGRRESGAPGDP